MVPKGVGFNFGWDITETLLAKNNLKMLLSSYGAGLKRDINY